jgi:hypothetical protein
VKGLLFLILCSFTHLASASEPGSAALDFLEKVRKGELNLDPGGDTALQANTAEGKLQSIRKRLKRLGEDLREGELELGEIREDAGYAAVMVHKVVGFDSTEIRVFPVAMVKRGANWLPAPVLASFENAVAGYTLPIRDRLSRLEEWMMRERVVDLEAMIAESAGRTRARIRKGVIGENLEGDDLGQIAGDFLSACAAKDRAAILGFLGGLSDPFPDDWAARLAASRLAVNGKGPWRLLAAAEVVRVPVLVERTEGNGMVSIACLDPAVASSGGTLGKIRLIHIDLAKDDSGHWRMDLPTALMSGDEDLLADQDGLDVDLLDRFPKRLRKLDPETREPSARAALDGVVESLKSPSLRDLLRRVEFGKRGKDSRAACTAAARLWWSLNEPGALRMPIEIGFKEEGESAAAVFQWFSVNDADRFEPTTLFFNKSGDGWIWSPGTVSAEEMKDHKALSEWAKANEPDWRLSWRGELMKPGTPVKKLGFGRVATDGEVSRLLEDWMDALGRKDIRRALSLSAWLGEGDEIPMKALRNLSFDLSSYRKGDWQLAGVHRSASWVAASVRQVVEGKVRNAFIPVVITGSGPRLIPEIDLFADDTRTRKFLNDSSFERLETFADKERVRELRDLFGKLKKD